MFVANIRRLALRSDLRTALDESGGLRDVHRNCARALVEHLRLEAAAIWQVADDGRLELAAFADRDGVHELAARDAGPLVRVVEECTPWDTASAASFPELALGGAVDLAHAPVCFGYPLLGADRAVGLLALYARRPLRAPTVELVAWVADLIAVTTANHRLSAERARLTDELRQSQKMEAMGLLVGGIAHDFNNLLTVIGGNVDVLLETQPADAPIRENLVEVSEAAERAKGLVNQLLAFGRRSKADPRPVDLNELVSGVQRMLARLLPADIAVEITPSSESCTVRVDPGQIEQVLINLAVNARDAMPAGGRLRFASRLVIFAEGSTADSLIGPGVYARLDVVDSGTGMPEAVRSRVFEPFFTTKPIGRGTGLGLSTAYGIVRQNQGFLLVDSEEGKGTTFSLLLPCHEAPRSEPAVDRPLVRPRGGNEVVLVVEDERAVRKMTVNVLRAAGYIVFQAGDSDEALKIGAELDALDLVIADVVIPRVRGPQLVEELRRLHPALKVLLISGYPPELDQDADPLVCLRKPFTPFQLLAYVRHELD